MSLPTPNTRKEQYLNAIATGNAGGLPTPITREEEYLDAIAKSGGGSGEGDMKKSVYDSDLAVSEAGGIKTFVNSAVAGKVDKVEGKGLSTNDYSDTEKGKVADNTSAIEAIVNEYGAKNLFDINNPVFISGFSVSGNVLTNSETDTKNIFTFDLRDNINTLYVNKDIGQNGHYEYTFTVSSAITYLIFKHNGASRDLRIDVKPVTQGDWIISFDVDGYNPSVVGGLEISKIMIRDARIKDPTYVPYAMTNAELTERAIKTKDITYSNVTVSANAYTLLGDVGIDQTRIIGALFINGDFSNHNSPKMIVIENGKAYLFNGADSGTLSEVEVRFSYI